MNFKIDQNKMNKYIYIKTLLYRCLCIKNSRIPTGFSIFYFKSEGLTLKAKKKRSLSIEHELLIVLEPNRV